MLKYSRTTIALTTLSAVASIVLFQNCAQTKFSSVSKSTASSFASSGGGEGYSGKLFVLVSPHKDCPSDPTLNPSEISVNADGDAYLMSQDCEPVNPPKLIDVNYGSNPAIMYFNAQTYRELGSSAPFAPIVNQVIADIQAENIMVKPSGYAIKNGFLVFNDNSEGDQTISFPSTGPYYFVFRALGTTYDSVKAQMQISIDGTIIQTVDVGNNATAQYTFLINVPAGTHTLGIAFINDDLDPIGDRDLLVDWFKIFN